MYIYIENKLVCQKRSGEGQCREGGCLRGEEVVEDGGEFVGEGEVCVGEVAGVEFVETVEFET